MHDTESVDGRASAAKAVVSTRYPKDRIKLLEAVQARRGDENLSSTVAAALDDLIEEHFPGSLK